MKPIVILLFLFPSLLNAQMVTDWHLFKQALIEQESGGDAHAVGANDDVGLFQITPPFLADVNEWIGYERYTLDDRFCPVKNEEIFELYQDRYNKNRCIERAIRLHNPRAGRGWYRDRIIGRLNDLRANYPWLYKSEDLFWTW